MRGPARVGLVCPYDLDVPGGVREQVLGLAVALHGLGHHVQVLGPRSGERARARQDPALEAVLATGVDVVVAGRATPLPTNGSTARLALGPVARRRAVAWATGSDLDVVHVHEPIPPGIGHSVLRALAGQHPRPAVLATVHVSLAPAPAGRSRALRTAAPHVRAALREVDVLSAVSEHARRTVVDHLGRTPLVVPNGVDVRGWAATPPPARRDAGAPTAVVVGRAAEPRKGVDLLLRAWEHVHRALPSARLVVVGPTEGARLPAGHGVRAVGTVDEATKRALVAGADVLVAPHRGGESFGLVLVEAMSVGTPVVASALPAFRDVLAGTGRLVAVGDVAALADALLEVLRDPAGARAATGAARARAADFDWAAVAARWVEVHDLAMRLRGGPVAVAAVWQEELARRAATSLALLGGHQAAPGEAAGRLAALVDAAREALLHPGADGGEPHVLAAHSRLTALARDPGLPGALRGGLARATRRLHDVRTVVNDHARRLGQPTVELDDAVGP